MSRIHCVTPCKSPRRRIGYCCPLCPFENSTAVVSDSDETTEVLQDPCVRCECKGGWCHCYREACPVLDCPLELQDFQFGSCCPKCKKRRQETTLVEGKCSFRSSKYSEELSFRPDPCTKCKCQQSGTLLCQRFVCPPVNCPPHRLYNNPLVCCPLCRNRDPLSCSFKGVIHKHGVSWHPDVCTSCTCENGEVSCSRKSCPHAHGCPKGYRTKDIPGKCCPECEERDGTCTVFGDPHYETFDGKAYNFQGTCRFVLARTCRNPSRASPSLPDFTVIVRNEPRGTKHYAWTRRVSIHLPNKIRVSLLPDKRVRMNRKRINVPRQGYVSLEHGFSIQRDKTNNTLFRFKDVKVLWDGSSYVELSVSPARKESLCGLCGDYNGDAANDLSMPSGDQTEDIYEFGMSWKWGAVASCGLATDREYLKRRAKEFRGLVSSHVRQLNRLAETFGGDTSGPGILGLPSMRPAPGGHPEPWGPSPHDTASRPHPVPDENSILSIFPGFRGRKPKPRAFFGQRGRLRSAQWKRRRVARPRLNPEDGHHLRRRGCRSKAKKRAQSMCRLLKKSSAFNQCRNLLSVSRYYRSCRIDACECPVDSQCHCESLFAYARACENHGFAGPGHVDWRHDAGCLPATTTTQLSNTLPDDTSLTTTLPPSPLCGSIVGAVFSLCARPHICQPTCAMPHPGLGPECDSGAFCRPGCDCPSGLVRYKDFCVPPEECPESIIGNELRK